jgi:hypothetical protein
MAGVRNSGEIPVCLLMGDFVDTGGTLIRPVEDGEMGSFVEPDPESAGMVEKCSYQGMMMLLNIRPWNSRLQSKFVSDEQQKLPNLLLHAIFRIDEIAATGTNDRGPYRRKSRNSVSPYRKIRSHGCDLRSFPCTLASCCAIGSTKAREITTRHDRRD